MLEKRPIGVGQFLPEKLAIRDAIIEGPGPFIPGGGVYDHNIIQYSFLDEVQLFHAYDYHIDQFLLDEEIFFDQRSNFLQEYFPKAKIDYPFIF